MIRVSKTLLEWNFSSLFRWFDFDGVSAPENETDLYGIRYAEFVVPLVKAMQEQQEMITQLKVTEEEQQEVIQEQQELIDGQ